LSGEKETKRLVWKAYDLESAEGSKTIWRLDEGFGSTLNKKTNGQYFDFHDILVNRRNPRKEKARIAREFVYTNHNYKLRAEKVIDVYNKNFGG
jgi:hypothetical protein